MKNDAPLDGDRKAPPVGGETTTGKSYLEFLERAGGGVVGGYNNFWLAGGTQLIVVDGQKRSSLVIDPPDGQVPPMKPEARERNRRFAAGGAVAPDASEIGRGRTSRSVRRSRSRGRSPSAACSASAQHVGPADAAELLLQQPQADRADQGHRHAPQRDGPRRARRPHERGARCRRRSASGWATRSATGKATRWSSTPPTSPTRRATTDRARTCTSSSASRAPIANTILYRFTVEDPTTWDRSWTGEYPWRATDEKLYEYACHEGNYSLGGMLRGARQKEADDAAKKKGKK